MHIADLGLISGTTYGLPDTAHRTSPVLGASLSLTPTPVAPILWRQNEIVLRKLESLGSRETKVWDK